MRMVLFFALAIIFAGAIFAGETAVVYLGAGYFGASLTLWQAALIALGAGLVQYTFLGFADALKLALGVRFQI